MLSICTVLAGCPFPQPTISDGLDTLISAFILTAFLVALAIASSASPRD